MKRFFLVIIPLVLLLVSIYTSNNRGAFWLNGNVDPAYIWYNNSKALAIGQSISHTDNPGTTVALTGALVFRSVFFFRSVFDITSNVIEVDIVRNPEFYLLCLQVFYLLLLFSLFVLLGVSLYNKISLRVALLFQLTPFLFGTLLIESITKVSPEPLILVAGILLLYFWILDSFNENKFSEYTSALIYASIVGFGIATKFIFVPLFFIPLFQLRTNKARVLYVLFSGVSFVLFTLPISHLYIKMIRWYYSIAIHTGSYGRGEVQVFNLSAFIKNIFYIFYHNLFLFFLYSLSLYFLIVDFLKKKSIGKFLKSNNQILTYFFVSSLIFVMVAKHYFANRYLIPVFIISSAMVLFLHDKLKNTQRTNFYFLIIMLVGFSFSLNDTIELTSHYRECKESSLKMLDHINKDYKDYAKVTYDDYSLDPTKIDSTYYLYNIRTKKYICFTGGNTNVQSIFAKFKNKVIFYGTPFDKGPLNFPITTEYRGYQMYKPDSVYLKDIYKGTNETFYVAELK